MKKFLNMDSVTQERVGHDLYILVENIVYKKIYLLNEAAICFYSEQEQHLIRVYESKTAHCYCILNQVNKNQYHYLH